MVYNKLINRNSGKSPGLDGWHPCLLMEISDLIDTPLSMLNEGVLPLQWLEGCITAIYKTGLKRRSPTFTMARRLYNCYLQDRVKRRSFTFTMARRSYNCYLQDRAKRRSFTFTMARRLYNCYLQDRAKRRSFTFTMARRLFNCYLQDRVKRYCRKL